LNASIGLRKVKKELLNKIAWFLYITEINFLFYTVEMCLTNAQNNVSLSIRTDYLLQNVKKLTSSLEIKIQNCK
jgi:hypothetical protein